MERVGVPHNDSTPTYVGRQMDAVYRDSEWSSPRHSILRTRCLRALYTKWTLSAQSPRMSKLCNPRSFRKISSMRWLQELRSRPKSLHCEHKYLYYALGERHHVTREAHLPLLSSFPLHIASRSFRPSARVMLGTRLQVTQIVLCGGDSRKANSSSDVMEEIAKGDRDTKHS